jgi:hypothetical protein
MRPEQFDPTAGERARVIREHREDPSKITDPTAGRRARIIGERGAYPAITDPTDPRYGQPGPGRDSRVAS